MGKNWEQPPIWGDGCRANWHHPDDPRSRQRQISADPRVKPPRFTSDEIATLRRMTGPQRVAWYESREAPDVPVDDWRGRAIFDAHLIRR